MKFITIVVLAGMIVGLANNSGAQVPRLISYQGFLRDNQGVPKPDGIYALTFRLYTVSTGGGAIWTEAKSVAVKNGLFSTVLGDVASLDAVAFDRQYSLGIQVATDPEFSPRAQLAASPYGFSAIRSDTAIVALSPWRLNGSTVYYNAGNVGIGSNTPEYPLTFGNSAGDKISLWNNYGTGSYYGLGLGSYQLQVHTDIPAADVVFGSGTSSSFNESARIKGNGILQFPATVQKKITLYPGGTGDIGLGVAPSLLKIYADAPGSDIAFGYDQSGSFTEGMRIKGNGNVGIGTSSPDRSLDIAGKLGVYDGTKLRYGGIATEEDATLINFGMNEDAVNRFGGSYSSADQGGLFRVDTRAGQNLFQFLGRPSGSSSGASEVFGVSNNGRISVNGSAGSAGQVLQSNGAGGATQWQTMGGILQTWYVWKDCDDCWEIFVNSNNEHVVPSLTTTINVNVPSRLVISASAVFGSDCSGFDCTNGFKFYFKVDGVAGKPFGVRGDNYMTSVTIANVFWDVSAGSHTIQFFAKKRYPDTLNGHVGGEYASIIAIPN